MMMPPEFKNEVQSRWAGMDATQRKRVVFLPILLLALLFATHPQLFRRRPERVRMEPQTVTVRPSDAPVGRPLYRRATIPGMASAMTKPAAPPSPETAPLAAEPGTALASGALDSPGAFAGKWQGRASVGESNVCALELEVNVQADNGFIAYPALSCVDYGALMQPKPGFNPMLALPKSNPVTAVLSGKWQDGSAVFTVDKVTTGNATGRAFTGLTLTPFGHQMTAQWKDTLGGGAMLLTRMRVLP
jgi:hypothetical protein